MADGQFDEGRIRRRVPFSAEIILTVEGTDYCYDSTQDISMSGMFICADKPLPVDTKGTMLLKLECGSRKAQVTAGFRVIRQQLTVEPEICRGMAIEFNDIDTDSSIILYNVVRYQDCDA